MKQILQSLKNGTTEVAEVPRPALSNGALLIKTNRSLVSSGTERMLMEFGKANLIEKARQQPDKLKMIIDKIKTDGLQPTLEVVFNKLDQPLPLGYCNVGVVAELGGGVTDFYVGDRVVSNGKHAEVVSVPKNLCATVPDNVSDDEAAFTVLAAIALQGIRLVKPTLGETVVVTGLGLIGLITVQLLRANGCRVLGIDVDPEKLTMAENFGAETVNLSEGQDPVQISNVFSRGRGVDAVLITASTNSNEPVHQAALMCRKRGRIVLVGVTGLELSRDDFFQKEISFQVSASYGPGRYDPNYEEKGNDYPVGFVRWTEQRNFEAVLDMMSMGGLDVKPLISHRFDIAQAEEAYELIGGRKSSLGILLDYPKGSLEKFSRTVKLFSNGNISCSQKKRVSFIGSGNYATAILIPIFKKAGAYLQSVISSNGVSGLHAGRKFGFQETSTDKNSIYLNKDTDAVVISTRHDSHADYVLNGIKNDKHIFVEKPLCLNLNELKKIHDAQLKARRILMVGFNRRFAPQVQKIKELLSLSSNPISIIMTVNAGAIPSDHWTQNPTVGGSRIVGEGCHFIDLLRFLAGVPIISYKKSVMSSQSNDTASIQLEFKNGSIGTIHYFANGPKSFSKERLEVFSGGGVLQLNNYRKLQGFNWPGFKKMNLLRQDKGQYACASAFLNSIENGKDSPIPLDEIIEVSRISIELA